MAQRVKGQESSVIMVGPAGEEEVFEAVKSIEATFRFDILSEDYVNEVTTRKDEIFKGCTLRVEFHLETVAYARLIERVKDRAQRREPGSRFDLLTTLAFPNGQRLRTAFEDAFFGDMPFNIGGREEYVGGQIEIEAPDARFLF